MAFDEALASRVRPLLAGKSGVMKGWLLVSAQSLERKAALETWVERGVEYARSLPAK
jgi:hypothetical protein